MHDKKISRVSWPELLAIQLQHCTICFGLCCIGNEPVWDISKNRHWLPQRNLFQILLYRLGSEKNQICFIFDVKYVD
jgi:hypothetical protein